MKQCNWFFVFGTYTTLIFYKSKYSRFNIIIKELCNVENFNSQINPNGDHVKVLLLSLWYYDAAFSILEEINYHVRKGAIHPKLRYIKNILMKF